MKRHSPEVIATQVIKGIERRSEAYSSDLVSSLCREVGSLRYQLEEALKFAPQRHLASLAERFKPEPEAGELITAA